MWDDLRDFYLNKKSEIYLVIITATATFLCTKALPWILDAAKRALVSLAMLVTGQLAVDRSQRKYLEYLVNDNRYRKGIPTKVVDPLQLQVTEELEKVFIRLKLRQGEDSVEFSTGELFQPGSRTVILGDPGAGKTTLLRYVCLTLARSRLLRQRIFRTVRRANEPFASSGKLVPILIFLNRSNLVTEGEQVTFSDLIESSIPETLKGDDLINFINSLSESGRAIFLLDGLDEITSTSRRLAVANAIGAFANTAHKNCTWIVTSRVVGYEPVLQQSGFALTVVERLTMSQVEGFVHDWYRVRLESSGFRADEMEYQARLHGQMARNLIEAFKSNPGLSELAINPMLVSLIALLHAAQVRLPENRSLLYQDCIDLLADRWDPHRGIHSPISRPLSNYPKTGCNPRRIQDLRAFSDSY